MATMEAPPRLQSACMKAHSSTNPQSISRREENARKMRAAIEKVRGQLGREYDLIIGGKHVKTAEKIKSLNPAKPSQLVGIHQKAGKEHVEPAMHGGVEGIRSHGGRRLSKSGPACCSASAI